MAEARGVVRAKRYTDPYAAAELARGAFSSLGFLSTHAAREVHTNSLRRVFARCGEVGDYRLGLATMQLMGEIQQLSGGYWLPTPVRAVPIGQGHMILAAIPTHRLAFEVPSTRRAGLARVHCGEGLGDLPIQALDNWMQVGPYDAAAWGDTELARLEKELKPSGDRSGLEYFHIAAPRGGARNPMPRFVWGDSPSPNPIRNRLHLCRERIGNASYRYCLVTRGRRGVVAEAQILHRPSRLMYAIAELQGSPIQMQVERQGSICRIAHSEPLPRAEYTLVQAIARRVSRVDGTPTFEVDEQYADEIIRRMEYLGYKREGRK